MERGKAPPRATPKKNGAAISRKTHDDIEGKTTLLKNLFLTTGRPPSLFVMSLHGARRDGAKVA